VVIPSSAVTIYPHPASLPVPMKKISAATSVPGGPVACHRLFVPEKRHIYWGEGREMGKKERTSWARGE